MSEEKYIVYRVLQHSIFIVDINYIFIYKLNIQVRVFWTYEISYVYSDFNATTDYCLTFMY